uniref:CASP-like protein 4A1 isoform X2 n=1 Tax=Rhizophora mucronata TaxID=61149 RepID=A0A2P2JV66_RHIMU
MFFPPQDDSPPKPSPPVVEINASKGPDSEVACQVEKRGGVGVGGGVSGRELRPSLSILRRAKREDMKRKVLLRCRILGFVFCLISFSVLAADTNRGWALDSFYRYKEFRFVSWNRSFMY